MLVPFAPANTGDLFNALPYIAIGAGCVLLLVLTIVLRPKK